MEDQTMTISHQTSKSTCSIKSLTILVVDDDTTCLSIVAAFLKSLKYQVVTVKHPNDALDTLKIKGSSFNLVITDVHMPDMNGFELQKKIDEEFKLPVVFMSADDQDVIMVKGLQGGASFFIVKPVSPSDLKHLWQYAFANKKGKAIIEEIEPTNQTPLPEKLCIGNTIVPKTLSSISNGSSNKTKERKRKGPMKEEIKDDFDDGTPKKAKFVWTSAVHNQFLEAIRSIGLDKAVPKKIVEMMNVYGLTRDHVASHLQKYRLFVKKVTETSSKVQLDHFQSATAPELPSDFLLRQSLGGYIPIPKVPKLGLSSSFNNRPPFNINSNPGSGKGILSYLYNKNYSKQPIVENSVSFFDTNSSVYGNKTKFPFLENFSERVVIGQEKPQLAHKGINSGIYIDMLPYENTGSFYQQKSTLDPNFKGLANFSKGVVFGQEKPQLAQMDVNNGIHIDMLGSENTGSFYHQKFNLDPNFKGLANFETSENKELGGFTDFVFKNEVMNGIRNESMRTFPVLGGITGDIRPNLGGTCGDNVPNLGTSANNVNQPTLDFSYQQQNNDNNGGENDEIFGPLNNISGSGNSYFPQQFVDQGDASFNLMNQSNIQPQTQLGVDEELIPDLGIAGSPSLDPNFHSLDPSYFQFDEAEFLRSLLHTGNDGGDHNGGAF